MSSLARPDFRLGTRLTNESNSASMKVETASTETYLTLPETGTEGPKRTSLLDYSRAPECVQTSFCTVRELPEYRLGGWGSG